MRPQILMLILVTPFDASAEGCACRGIDDPLRLNVDKLLAVRVAIQFPRCVPIDGKNYRQHSPDGSDQGNNHNAQRVQTANMICKTACKTSEQVLERVKGIEPSSSAWKAVALPLSYTRAG